METAQKSFSFDNDLFIWKPSGTLDYDKVDTVLAEIEKLEFERDEPFNRFHDFRDIVGVIMDYKELSLIAHRRVSYFRNGKVVKSAFLTSNPLGFGLAKMFQDMLSLTDIHAKVFKQEKALLKWLKE